LIVATGRNALPITAHVARRTIDRLIAVFATANDAKQNHESRLLVEASPEGWWYRCPSADGQVQIAFVSDADLVRTLRRSCRDWFVEQLSATEIGAGLAVHGPAHVAAADTYCREAVIGENLILVGDAALARDPLAGNGVTLAVASGLRAADVVAASEEDRARRMEVYSMRILIDFIKFLRVRSATYRQVERWSDRPFWSRRQDSSNSLAN
jgi:flavin-dependent dehydrogenase